MVRLLTGMGRKSIGFAWWPRCSMHGGLGLSSPRVAGEWAEVHRDACEKHSLKSAHLGLAPLSDSMERDAHLQTGVRIVLGVVSTCACPVDTIAVEGPSTAGLPT
eukprot:scaffold86717_cov28-Tisochrysis_lutea.AAC.5